MSLLIKALQKAEQSKDAKAAENPVSKAGLSLELAPQEPKAEFVSVKVEEPLAPPKTADTGLSLSQSEPAHQMSTAISGSNKHASEPSLADEAGFTEPLSIKPQPLKVELPKAEPVKAESAKPVRVSKPVEKVVPDTSVFVEPASAASKAIPEPSAQRQAAASMLSLQPDDRKRSTNSNRRSLWLGGVALVLLLVMGGSFYYYLQTLDQPQLVAMQPMPRPTPTPPVTAANQPAEAVAVAANPVTPSPAPEIQDTVNKADVIEAKPEKAMPAPASTSGDVITEPRQSRAKASRQPSGTGDNPLQVARLRKGEPAANATHVAAYQAFISGDDVAAGRLYKQLLQADARNVDALLGLAAVAARQDHMDEAASYYQRSLELDPKNSIAQAGLIALLGQANPTEATSRLKTLITQQPEAAYLHAALGGVYADQNQWPNAQQAYFQAFRLDSGSADHAFNLAVSLDQMNKPDLALDYYQRALGLLPRQGGAVDKVTLESRIDQLRSALGK